MDLPISSLVSPISGRSLIHQYKTEYMEMFIIISILVIIAGVFIVLRMKQKNDKDNPPHSPLR